MKIIEKIEEAGSFIASQAGITVLRAGIILGSGLGSFGDTIETICSIRTSDVPHWPESTVKGHRGTIIIGTIAEKPVAVVQGRVHLYEGYTPEDVVFCVRVLGSLGIDTLVLTNAAGSTNSSITPGSIMAVTDHLNMMGTDPLTGRNIDSLGPRFPHMNEAYCADYRSIAENVAKKHRINLYRGVLAATHGPSYETPAEVQALKMMGADAVCMSTIPEVIAASHMGIQVLALSCITNMAAGMSPSPPSHGEVEAAANRIAGSLNRILRDVIYEIVSKDT